MRTDYDGDEEFLQKQEPQGTTDSPYDLSQGGETANCYMVDAPGTYKLPLVYGNAMNNSTAYQGFFDYKNNKITSPDISGVKDCILVWSDAFYLFKNVHLSNDGKFLIFTLDKDYMQQANAIVAARDVNGTIMWSWHIWVTDHKNDIENNCYEVDDWENSNQKYHLMPYNLGWVDGKMVYYNQRDLVFDFKQDITDTPAKLNVTQEGVEYDYMDGGSTYYQWGRKDPIVALKNRDESNSIRPHETSDSKYEYKFESAGETTIGKAIQNPNIYYVGTPWLNNGGFFDKLWNVKGGLFPPATVEESLGDIQSTKTIYDPSPVGFKVPPSRAFAVFVNGSSMSAGGNNECGTLNGQVVIGENNVVEVGQGKYGYVYRVYPKKNRGGTPIDLIATGQRAYKAGLGGATEGGLWAMYGVYYWTCQALNKEGAARSFCVRYDTEPTDVYTIAFSGTQTMARPVRCIKDE